MKSTPIYIKSLDICGIKTLNTPMSLFLTRKDESLPQWTVILGDNGIGKSTLLQAIAWMKPFLPYDSKDIPADLEPAPIINDEENEVLEKLVSRHHPTDAKAYLKAIFVANQKLKDSGKGKGVENCKTSIVISLNKKGKLSTVESKVDVARKSAFYKDEVVMYGYSASRQLGELNLSDPKLADTVHNFIKEKTVLYDAEEILHSLNYSALGAKNDADKLKYKDFINKVKLMLVQILPDFEEVADIEIAPPDVLSNKSQGGVLITTKHGEKLPFSDFSLGYKTVVSWTIDLAWRMFRKYHERSPEPLKEPAIVIVDEIDLHLHPIWQREIMYNLSEHFPNVQFIATAHSPLMIQAAIQSNYAVLKFEDGNVILINEPKMVDGWRIDQILTSELFGLPSARGLKYDELIERRETLLTKGKLSANDKRELANIDKQIRNLPTGENPDDIDTRKAVAEVIKNLKQEKIVIKL